MQMAPSYTYSIDSISSSFTSSTRSSSTRHPSEFPTIASSSSRTSAKEDDLTRTGPREPRDKRRPTSPRFNRPASPSQSSTKSTQSLLPGKRGKAAQLGMVAVIFFPPMSIFFIFMLPAILFVSSKLKGKFVSRGNDLSGKPPNAKKNQATKQEDPSFFALSLSLSLSHHPVLCGLVSLLEDGTQHDLLKIAPGSAEDLEAQQGVFWSDRKQHFLDPCGNIASQVPLLGTA